LVISEHLLHLQAALIKVLEEEKQQERLETESNDKTRKRSTTTYMMFT